MNIKAELERLAEWWEREAENDRERAAAATGSVSRAAAFETLANVGAGRARALRAVISQLVTEAAS